VEQYYPFGLAIKPLDQEGFPDHRFTYNGKEFEEETGYLDYHARQMDSQLGRFMSVDPLADDPKQVKDSPFAYVANNPVIRIDHDGMIWKDQKKADAIINAVTNKIGELMSDVAKAQWKLDNNELSEDKTNSLNNEISKLEERITGLRETVESIIILGNDLEHTYDLVNTNDESHHVRQDKDGVINIEGSSTALRLHELSHVAQELNSESGFQFNQKGVLIASSPAGLREEINAYTFQYYYDPNSLPTVGGTKPKFPSDITIQYLGGIKNSKGKPVYPKLAEQIRSGQNLKSGNGKKKKN